MGETIRLPESIDKMSLKQIRAVAHKLVAGELALCWFGCGRLLDTRDECRRLLSGTVGCRDCQDKTRSPADSVRHYVHPGQRKYMRVKARDLSESVVDMIVGFAERCRDYYRKENWNFTTYSGYAGGTRDRMKAGWTTTQDPLRMAFHTAQGEVVLTAAAVGRPVVSTRFQPGWCYGNANDRMDGGKRFQLKDGLDLAYRRTRENLLNVATFLQVKGLRNKVREILPLNRSAIDV